jgi:arsenate reductase-like glutaredoxin family protein
MRFSDRMYELARPFYNYKPATPNVPILYYVDINHKEYHQVVNFLDKNDINYVPIKLHERMVDEAFIHVLLGWTKGGFDDIVRLNFFKYLYPNVDIQELRTKELVKMIVKDYVDLLSPFIFVDTEGNMITRAVERDFLKYKKGAVK